MEPRQHESPAGIERAPVSPGSYETSIGGGQEFERGNERARENRPEVGSANAEAAQIAMPTLPVVPVVFTSDDNGQAATDDDLGALVANDDDLIEKEWVDKAKKILGETKDDPHRHEVEVAKLQAEYIRRRYGREIGNAGD